GAVRPVFTLKIRKKIPHIRRGGLLQKPLEKSRGFFIQKT
ncbi:MAG: hypothetical protein ACI83B_003778, partial [Sediminicola sp.]